MYFPHNYLHIRVIPHIGNQPCAKPRNIKRDENFPVSIHGELNKLRKLTLQTRNYKNPSTSFTVRRRKRTRNKKDGKRVEGSPLDRKIKASSIAKTSEK
jgi:hypothetical protein